jgi:hypothetical protein
MCSKLKAIALSVRETERSQAKQENQKIDYLAPTVMPCLSLNKSKAKVV